jgi:sugar phosphate isomerase/epimerase
VTAGKLSFSTNAFVRFLVPEAIEIIAKIGYSGVEILADIPHLDPSSTTAPDLAAIASALEKNRIRAVNINANTATGWYREKFWEPVFEPSLANPDEAARKWRVDYTKKCIDIAASLGCPNISVTSGRMVPGMKPEKSLALLRGSIMEIMEHAGAKGIRVGMEYEPGLLVERAEELAYLIGEVADPNFGVNLDLGHSYLAGESPAHVAQTFGSRIFHIHIEDIKDRKHYHLVPGEGQIDFGGIAGALADINYGGFVTVELYTFPENPQEAAQKAFDYLKKIL